MNNIWQLFFILIPISCCSGFVFASDKSGETEKAFQAKDYFSRPYIANDINQEIILVEIDQSKKMLERAYSSSHFGARESDGQVGYFDPKIQYRYHSDNHYFEEDNELKQGQHGAWDGRFLNWLLMRQIDMTRYLLLGAPKKKYSTSLGKDEFISLDSSKHKLIMHDATSLSYSPIPSATSITIDSGYLQFQGKRFQLRLKNPRPQKGLLGLLTKNINLYFYFQTSDEFIFGNAKSLPTYLKQWSVSESHYGKTQKEGSSASFQRALAEIKLRSQPDDAEGQSEVCQRYVYLSLSSSSDSSLYMTNNNILDDCQKSLSGKQALTYFRLMVSDKEAKKSHNSFTFHTADTLMTSIFKVLSGDYAENSYQISGADMAYFTDKSGVIYQSLYKYALTGSKKSLHWLGDLRATLVDELGRLRSDNGDRKLGTLQEDPLLSSCFDEQDKQLRIRLLTKPGSEEDCNALNYPYFEKDVGYLWQASDFLNKVPQASINRQRSPFQSNDTKRYIRTHIGQTEYDFVESENAIGNYPVKPEWMNLSTQREANKLISYIRGQDQTDFRQRHLERQAFLLGDTSNRAPVVVGKPSSNYHLLYNDQSYQQFVKQYQNRRARVFLGTNDGMLHSFNAGWFDPKAEQLKDSPINGNQWTLGQEIWTFVPSTVLPYLSELSDKYYGLSPQHHLNISPQIPYIFDAKIFTEHTLIGQEDRLFIDQEGRQFSQETHPQGWGTLMVVGTGLGSSSYLVFDITDAEQAPKLMAELKVKNSGSAISLASVMTHKNQQGKIEWSLVLGSGTDLDPDSIRELGSTRSAGIYMFDLQNIQSRRAQLYSKFIDLKEAASYVTGISAADWDLDGETDVLYLNTASGKNNTGSIYRIDARHSLSGKSPWKAEKLLDAQAPLLGRPQLSIDAMNNRWLYVATASVIQTKNRASITTDKYLKDKIIGLKEPRDSQGAFLIENSRRQGGQISLSSLVDVSDVLVNQETGSLTGSLLIQPNLREKTVTQLENRLMQFSDSPSYVDGWLRNLEKNEVASGSSSLFGGILMQATYHAEDKNCLLSADAYMHRLRFTTGTSWYAQGQLENKANRQVAELQSTKSHSLGSRELTSMLLHGGSEHIHQIQSSSNGHTQTTLEESRKRITSGEVSWREL